MIQAWHVLEPSTEFLDGIPIDAICSHLQAITEGHIGNLLINVPPRHAKSLLVCVFWPAWVWIDHPEARWLFASHRQPLGERDSLKCRSLIESEWYQQRWGDRFQLRKDQNQKQRFENDCTGSRIVVPMFAGTGEGGDYVVVDDPHTVDQAESDTQRTATVEWWTGAMSTRINNPSRAHKVVVQQRRHEADLTGDLLMRGGYEHLCLPAEFEPERRCRTSIGWQDPRTEAGELLWPERFDQAVLERHKAELGSYRYAGQFQQRPTPASGGIFQGHWFSYWRPAQMDLPPVLVRMSDGQLASIQAIPLPEEFDCQIQSWDLAFKDKATSDYVVGQLWAAKGADRFLLDQRRERMDMPQTKEAIRRMSEKWPQAGAKLVEDKANGPAVIQELQHEIAGLIEVTPEGGKTARANAAAPQVESGNICLPHPALYPWVEEFIAEATTFPNGRNDDQVDAMTQAMHHLRSIRANFGVPESQIIVPPFRIPDLWPQALVVTVTRTAVACLWGARDPNGTIYLYAEHMLPDAEPAMNAEAIKERGARIPGLVHTPSFKRSEADKHSITALYRKHGLSQVCAAQLGEEAGVYHLRELLAAQKLKVFSTLSGFLSEYRIGDESALLLQCCFVLLAGRACMRPKVIRQVEIPTPSYGGGRSWMA